LLKNVKRGGGLGVFFSLNISETKSKKRRRKRRGKEEKKKG